MTWRTMSPTAEKKLLVSVDPEAGLRSAPTKTIRVITVTVSDPETRPHVDGIGLRGAGAGHDDATGHRDDQGFPHAGHHTTAGRPDGNRPPACGVVVYRPAHRPV